MGNWIGTENSSFNICHVGESIKSNTSESSHAATHVVGDIASCQPFFPDIRISADALDANSQYIDLIKTQLYSMLEAPQFQDTFSFLRTLEPIDQALFIIHYVDLICSLNDNRFKSYQICTSGTITIDDYITVMQKIAPHVSRRYKLFRNAYRAENNCGKKSTTMCTDGTIALIYIIGAHQPLSQDTYLLFHNNYVTKFSGSIRLSRYVNPECGLGFWCKGEILR